MHAVTLMISSGTLPTWHRVVLLLLGQAATLGFKWLPIWHRVLVLLPYMPRLLGYQVVANLAPARTTVMTIAMMRPLSYQLRSCQLGTGGYSYCHASVWLSSGCQLGTGYFYCHAYVWLSNGCQLGTNREMRLSVWLSS
jgi:hypothetical protein